MKRITFILVLVFLMFTTQVGFAAVSLQTNDLLNTVNYDQFNLSRYSFSLPDLPDQKLKSFSPGAQEKLLDMALLYGEDRGVSLDKSNLSNVNESNDLIVGSLKQTEDDKLLLEFNPMPDVKINADYNKGQQDYKVSTETNINLKYQMNEKTQIRAGYGLVNENWWDVKSAGTNTDQKSGTVSDDGSLNDSSSDGTVNTDKTITNDSDQTGNNSSLHNNIQNEFIYNENESSKSNIGISYQTSDRVTVSADYVNEDTSDNSAAVFGVEYADNLGKLRAKYKIDNGDIKETVTGLELNLKDLATVSASYKLLNPELIKDKLQKESVWDFGVDFNLTDFSSLSIGYQLIDNKDTQEENTADNQGDKESSIKASFQINF